MLLLKYTYTSQIAMQGFYSSKEIPSEVTVSTPLLSLHWHQVAALPSTHQAADVWQNTLHNLLENKNNPAWTHD